MLSKTAEYALRAVACMAAQPGVPASADHLAEITKVPRRYLTRVLQDLCSAGLVTSRPGPGGGYELARDAGKLTILDVVNTVAPIERIRSCPLGLKSHHRLCPLHANWIRPTHRPNWHSKTSPSKIWWNQRARLSRCVKASMNADES